MIPDADATMSHCGFLCPIGNPFERIAHHYKSIADHGRAYYNTRHGDGHTRTRPTAGHVSTDDGPTAASHPFYRRLDQLLREHRFDDFVEAQCAISYAETMGRPDLPPKIISDCCWSATSKVLTQSAASRGARRTPSRYATFSASGRHALAGT